MNGVDLSTIQELLGHKSIVMTKRYSHPTPEHKKKAITLINIYPNLQVPKTEIAVSNWISLVRSRICWMSIHLGCA